MDSIALHHLQAAGFRVFSPVLIDQGDTGAPSRIHIRARDLAGVVAVGHVGPLRVRVCNAGVFANSTNANDEPTETTMANATWGGAKLAGGIDAVPGTYGLDLTDASAETVTLRVGPAPQGAYFGDFSSTLTVTHAAP